MMALALPLWRQWSENSAGTRPRAVSISLRAEASYAWRGGAGSDGTDELLIRSYWVHGMASDLRNGQERH